MIKHPDKNNMEGKKEERKEGWREGGEKEEEGGRKRGGKGVYLVHGLRYSPS